MDMTTYKAMTERIHVVRQNIYAYGLDDIFNEFRTVTFNGKYLAKGEKGCESKHVDDGVLYQVFVDVFNAIVENKRCFLEKWQKRLASDNVLVRYKARQFIGMLKEAKVINEFDVDLYFALTERISVYADCRLIVSLLDGTDIECEVE